MSGFLRNLFDAFSQIEGEKDEPWGRGSTSQKSANVHQCIHCGQPFDFNKSEGWRMTQEQFTCNWCYKAGKRDSEDYDVW